MNTATYGAGAADAGVASAMVNTIQQVGGSIGTALLNTIAASALTSYLLAHGRRPLALAPAAVHSYVVAFWVSAADPGWLRGRLRAGAAHLACRRQHSEPPVARRELSGPAGDARGALARARDPGGDERP